MPPVVENFLLRSVLSAKQKEECENGKKQVTEKGDCARQRCC